MWHAPHRTRRSKNQRRWLFLISRRRSSYRFPTAILVCSPLALDLWQRLLQSCFSINETFDLCFIQGELMMIRRMFTIGMLATLLLTVSASAADNQLTDQEKSEGYKLLFNGSELKGWHRNSDGFGGWRVEDGALCLDKGGGMIYADETFDNFILKVDFKMSAGCNSGIFIRVGDPKNEVQTGLEIQVQDDYGKKPNRNSAGSIYDLVAPTKNVVKPAGEWNSCTITADGSKITVELNGEMVAQINVDEWDKPGLRPDGSKHKYKAAIKEFPRKGLIGFQDHGKPVCFKNVRIKPLKAN